ncbi:hypothetical protein ACN4EK_07545 [Pantanalinema rosaneae CENA516]|uniref:hypothetical protein n=1 Tax=Pantanalinema rosaneae TaxID=1620701 RepID=UPI003D6FF913
MNLSLSQPRPGSAPTIAGAAEMKTQWQHTLIKITLWLATEILLTCVGLDNMADYGEFVFGQEFSTTGYHQAAITACLN